MARADSAFPLLKISPRSGQEEGATRHLTTHTAQPVETVVVAVSPSVLSPRLASACATCFSEERGRTPGHPRHQPHARSLVHTATRHPLRRTSRVASKLPRPPAPCVAHPHPRPPTPHAVLVVVALDATPSPRACRGMLLDSYGGCRPPRRRL